jgi:hypothetical protein
VKRRHYPKEFIRIILLILVGFSILGAWPFSPQQSPRIQRSPDDKASSNGSIAKQALGSGTNYYIDATHGKDTYNGKTPIINEETNEGPWKTIARANALFNPKTSVGSTVNRGDFSAGNAFFISSLDLSNYAGTDSGSTPCQIEVIDIGGKKAKGYMGSAGSGSKLDAELKLDPGFDDDKKWIINPGWKVSGSMAVATEAASGQYVYQSFPGDPEAFGRLYYWTISGAVMTAGATRVLTGGVGSQDLVEGTSSGYTNTKGDSPFHAFGLRAGSNYFSGMVTALTHQRLIEPWPTGVHIVSEVGGSRRNWASIESGFDPNMIVSWSITSSDKLSAGDSILFKRGETFYGPLTISTSGSAGTPIIIGAYGTGAKPILNFSFIVSGWSEPANGVYSKWIPNLYPIDELFQDSLLLPIASSSTCRDGIWFWDDGSDILYYKPTSGVASDHIVGYLQGQNYQERGGITLTDQSNISIDGIALVNFESGIFGKNSKSASSNITIKNCDFRFGYNAVYFLANSAGPNDHFLITGNFFYRCHGGVFGYSYLDGASGKNTNWVVSNNEMAEVGTSNGTNIWPHAYTGDMGAVIFQNSRDCMISGNYIHDGNQVGICLWGTKDGGVCSGNTISRNRIYNTTQRGLTLSGDNTDNTFAMNANIIANNILWNTGTPIAGENEVAMFLDNTGAGTEMNFVYNNIIYGTYIQLYLSNFTRFYTVKNNIFAGGVRATTMMLGTEPPSCVIDYNCYDRDSIFLYGGSYRKLAWMVSNTSFDDHSFIADPKFLNSYEGDFHLLSNSPCRGTGSDVGLTTDFDGNPIPAWPGKKPDIGAYESGLPIPTLLPTVITTVPSSISSISATGGGNVASEGSSAVMAKGVCWSKVAHPSTADLKTMDGSGAGSYSSAITGLQPGTTYCIRAYATNSLGTSYGNELNFSTEKGTSSEIGLSRTRLAFGAASSDIRTPSQSITITNLGIESLNWTAIPQQSWINISRSSGTGSTTISVGVNPAGLPTGKYAGQIAVSAPEAINSPGIIYLDLTVYTLNSVNKPFGSCDTPQNGTAVGGSIPIMGWALDDIGIQNVRIYRDPTGNEQPGSDGLVFIGDAVFVEGARPDVEQAFPSLPLNNRAGWGYMLLTNFLPNQGNGTFTLRAVATNFNGGKTELGSKTIIGDNSRAIKPFGTIDTPTQGGIIFGSAFVNFGWVLTPLPKSIPIDGSTITVWVDGLPLGHPTYNNFRSDIATLFPGYANANGAVGYYSLDTTGFENKLHSIAWSVADSAGAVEGIGSRYFQILNTGSGFQVAEEESKLSGAVFSIEQIQNTFSDIRGPVYFKREYDFTRLVEPCHPDRNGRLRVLISELERVTIYLDPTHVWETREELETRGQGLLRANNSIESPRDASLIRRFTAYLIVGSELRPLPVGSTFDPESGILYWQSGPGFLGDFNFVFIDHGMNTKRTLTVRIEPK